MLPPIRPRVGANDPVKFEYPTRIVPLQPQALDKPLDLGAKHNRSRLGHYLQEEHPTAFTIISSNFLRREGKASAFTPLTRPVIE
jgi:hypothetical protein